MRPVLTRIQSLGVFLLLFTSVIATNHNAYSEENVDKVMLVLDVSGSMWGQIEGTAKIEIARDALKSLVSDWPESRQVGLIAYGHRNKGDCKDIETVVPVGPLNRNSLGKIVSGLTPRGMTPLSASVKKAAEELKYTEGKATVILISDGVENCDLDPCKIGAELEKQGVDFTAHVIGFDVTSIEDQKGLKCLADNTGGLFLPATNAEQLSEALNITVASSEPLPATPEPEVLPEGKIIAAETIEKGTELDFTLEAKPGVGGYVMLYPADKDRKINYTRVIEGDSQAYLPGKIRMPVDLGEYDLKWETKNRKVIASTRVTVVDADIKISAPETVIMGTEAEIDVTSAPMGLRGYIYLYPAGRDKHISHAGVREDAYGRYTTIKMRMPAEVGDYVLRWESSNREVLAERDIKVTGAEMQISAPATAMLGTEVDIDVSAPEGLRGYIYLYPEGKTKSIAHSGVRENPKGGYLPVKMRMPAAAGNFILKWESNSREVLAETKIELTNAEISIKGPDEAPAGTQIELIIEAPERLSGYVYLFAAGKDKSLSYAPVREAKISGYEPVKIRVPAVAGDFELKWLTNNKEVLAEKNLKVLAVDISLSAPTEVLKDAPFEVAINAPAGIDGYLYLHKKGIKKPITYRAVREGKIKDYEPVQMKAPEVEGEYEIKWLSNKQETLAETTFKVVGEVAATDNTNG
jgi:Ca-activated chloride channel family protein